MESEKELTIEDLFHVKAGTLPYENSLIEEIRRLEMDLKNPACEEHEKEMILMHIDILKGKLKKFQEQKKKAL